MEKRLSDLIVEKYIAPTRREPGKTVGIEIEMPIVNLDDNPVDFDMIHTFTEKFVKDYDFKQISRDDNGDIYLAVSEETEDGISYDCSYNTLELSFGPEEDISVIEKRFADYVTYIQENLEKENHIITGMGVNPNYKINRNEPIPNERYRMLFHHLASYEQYEDRKIFHRYPNFGLFSCASQVQLDVKEDNIPQVINVFSKLEPVKAVLFANSLWQEDGKLLCARDMFWRDSLHGLNLHNVDMVETELSSVNDVVEYIKSMSLYCVMREGKYINFEPLPLRTYFQKESIEGEYCEENKYKKMIFKPEWNDLSYLRSFKFEDLTYRGTVEFRSSCTQPLSEAMTVAAFHAGLMEKTIELEEILKNDTVLYGHGYSATELRKMLCCCKLPEFVDQDKLSELLYKILELAKEGLEIRGFGEEKYLEPLYERVKQRKNPAMRIKEGSDSGMDIKEFILEYARLKKENEDAAN